jgi:hypothetical protein
MTAGWLEKVAERAGVGVPEADAVLKKWGIRPDRAAAAAPRLRLKRIMFYGFKRGVEAEPFRFEWASLEPGVWAIGSYDNLVGKSTVIEVVLWALRGQPKDLQPDIRRRWLRSVEVDFELDQRPYAIRMMIENGIPSGSLSRFAGTQWQEVDGFTSESGFAAVMARFMMEAFGLDPIPSWQNKGEEGQPVSHGWAALAGAMYLGGDHSLLFGEIEFAGLPGRMLQMFVGLPWAQTTMYASTAEKEIKHKAAAAVRAAEATKAAEMAASDRLFGELETARELLNALPDLSVTDEGLDTLGVKAGKHARALRDTETQLKRAEDDAAILKSVADEDEQDVRSIRETAVAGRFFNGLHPTCCPRCETRISKDRTQQESVAMQCAVCSHPITMEQQEEFDEQLALLEERARLSRSAAERAAALVRPLRMSEEQLQQELSSTQQAFDAVVRASGAASERRKLELEIARLEGALNERQRPVTPAQERSDGSLIEAALKEAVARRDSVMGDIFSDLNAEILRLGHTFGIVQLEQIDLNSRAQMAVTKGGVQTSFKYLSPGERLRLRIATVVALLRVGNNRGIGRHPGVLFVDSPGAEETNEQDLASLLRELQTIAAELPDLQVFIASADARAVEASVDPKRRRIAAAGAYLW